MARCKSSWGALACVLGIYSLGAVALADEIQRAQKALTEATTAKNAASRCEYAATQGEAEATTAADKADFAKTRDECRLLKNDGARAETPMKRLIERAKAPPQQPDPTPDPVPDVPPQDPEPDPQPDPVPSDPSPPVGDAITIDGVRLLPVSLGNITTPTGVWPVDRLDYLVDGKGYLVRLTSRPDWWSICVVRVPDGSGTISERTYELVMGGNKSTLGVLPGSMKCADNGEPIAPSMERLRKAVADKRVIPVSAAAFAGWPKTPALKADRSSYNKLGYDPARIYGRSASNNAIGVVVGSAGEASSSRGFISGDDGVMIAAALAGDQAVFADAAEQNRVQMLYGLSLPNLAIWSDGNDMLRDPQIPLAGDRPYVNEGSLKDGDGYGNEGKWCAPANYPFLAEIGATAGTCYAHTRDEAHLFNHGYAYWLATGDPRAAILQQAIGAYALASEYRGAYPDGRYRTRFGYQRTTLNMWNAMWKVRDVARTASGPLLWPRARAEKMVGDITADWKAKIAAMDASSDIYEKASSIFRGIDNGVSATDSAYSWFMQPAYGPDSAYLFAVAGEPALLRRLAENAVLRLGKIGGARGYNGPDPVPSGFRLLPNATEQHLAESFNAAVISAITDTAFQAPARDLPYSDTASFVAWVNANSSQSTTSFEGAQTHYVIRLYWTLRYAKAAGLAVPGLDDAIAKAEAARDATTTWKSAAQIDWKHAGVPFAVVQ